MSAEVKQLGPEHASSLRALLSRDPLRNLHPLSALEEMNASAAHGSLLFGYFSAAQLRAAALVRGSLGLVVPATCGPSEAFSLGAGLVKLVSLRCCFGDREVIEPLLRGLSPVPARLVRAHRLFTASADNLGPFVTSSLRLATERDVPTVLSLSRLEIEEISDEAPLRLESDAFEADVLGRLRAQRTWVLEVDDRVVVKIDMVARSSFGAELQGLFTSPPDRFRGYATLALGQLSRYLLSSLPRLTLRIADSADSLLAVAKKVGYVSAPTEQLIAFA
jgi:hypothetical protein